MTKVFTRDGQTLELQADEAQAKFLSGEVGFAPGEHQVFIGGEVRGVDANNLKAALQTGGRLATSEEVQQIARVAEWDTTAGALMTGAAEAGNALTMGLMDVGLTQALGEEYAEDRRSMREANPDAALTGQIGGEVLGILGSGGLGLAAKGGVRAAGAGLARLAPAAMATRGALAAEKAAASILGRGVIAKGVSTAAGAAVETSLFEMGRALSDASIQEGDHSAEEIMLRMGEWASNDLPGAAGIGAGVGGVFGLTFGLAGKAGRFAKKSMAERAAGGRPGEILPDRMVREALEDPDLLEELSDFGQEALNTPTKGGDSVTEVTRSYRDQGVQLSQAKQGVATSLRESLRGVGEVLGLTKVQTANINATRRHLARDGYNVAEASRGTTQFYDDALDALGHDKKMVAGLTKEKRNVERQLAAFDRADERAVKGFERDVSKRIKALDSAIAKAPAKARRAAAAERKVLKDVVELDDIKRKVDEGVLEQTPKLKARINDIQARIEGSGIDLPEGGARLEVAIDNVIDRIRKARGLEEGAAEISGLERLRDDVLLESGPPKMSRTQLNGDLHRLDLQLQKRAALEGIDEAEKRGINELALLVRESRERAEKILGPSFGGPQEGARLYTELDVLNRRIGRMASENSRHSVMVKEQAKKMHEALRVQMIDKDVWGKGLATDHERLNAAWARWYDNVQGSQALTSKGKGERLTHHPETGERLVNTAELDPYKRVANVDTRKIESFMDQIGDRRNGTAEREVLGWIDSNKELIRTITETTGEISEKQARLAIGRLDDLRASMGAGARTRVQADAFTRSMGTLAQAATMARNVAPGVKAAGMFIEPVAALGGAALGKAEQVLSAAILSNTGQRMLQRLRGQGQKRVQSAITKFVKEVTTGKTGRGARLRSFAIPVQFGSSKNEKNRFRYAATVVRNFQEDPKAAIARGVNNMGPMAVTTPNTSAMFASRLMEQGTFLAQKLPPMPDTGPFGTKDFDKLLDRVPRSQRRQFTRYFEAISNPSGVLSDLSEGKLTKESVESLEAGWPLLYNKVRSGLQTELATAENIPFTTLAQLSQLFQIPLHPALQGKRIASLQQVAREAGGAPQRSESAIAPSRAVAPDMAAELATRSQQLEGKVRG